MAKLTTSKRNAMPASQFALPAQRAYPVPDASHAANAKARATQQVAAGNLTPAQKATVDAKVNKVLSHEPKRHRKNGRGFVGMKGGY